MGRIVFSLRVSEDQRFVSLRMKQANMTSCLVIPKMCENAVILDPDDYLISLFEPTFGDKAQQTGGYQGFTPA